MTSKTNIRLVAAAIALLGAACSTGCATVSLWEYISDANNFKGEFEGESWEIAPKVVEGWYLGVVKSDNMEFHKYSFPSALGGRPNRGLVLRIPLDKYRRKLDDNPVAFGRETRLPPMSDVPARLFIEPRGYEHTQPGMGRWDRWPDGVCPEQRKDVGVVILWANGPGSDDMIIAQAAPGVIKRNEAFNSYYVRPNVGYIRRNGSLICLANLGYVVSVPFDIITSPVQLSFAFYFWLTFDI